MLGHPVAPLPLAGDAERGARGARARRELELRGDRPRPRRTSSRASGRCPARGSSAPTSPSPTRRPRWRSPTSSSEVAREIGAANTLGFEAGAIRAENTDAAGLIAALPGARAGSRALVLGAGGAARAVVWALVREGAEVEVWNRTESRARRALRRPRRQAGRATPDAAAYDLIVNSTAVGLGGEDPFAELPLRADALHAGQVVVDLVYGDGPGALLEAAAAAGARRSTGSRCWSARARPRCSIWTGLEPPWR